MGGRAGREAQGASLSLCLLCIDPLGGEGKGRDVTEGVFRGRGGEEGKGMREEEEEEVRGNAKKEEMG